MKIAIRLIFLALVLCHFSAHAQIVDPQNVLIQNVYLIDNDEATDAVLVNILIKDNKLDIVSQDDLPDDSGVVVVDARNGYLLGKLKIGETPSFIILNQDPSEDFEILLDTSFFTIFAIHNGRLLRNNLFSPDVDQTQAESVPKGWTAYSPPPMALPLSYLDSSKWNRWDSKYVSGIFLAGVVLDRMNWLTQDSDSEQQVGDLGLFDGGEIRGLRLGAVGTLNFDKPWVYTIFGATNAFDKGFETEELDGFALFDYRLDIPVLKGLNLSIGKQKEPISMERIMSMAQIPMQERTSVSDALLPSRNFGAVLSGTAMNQRMSWAGGVFNDWVDTNTSFGDSATQWIGRVTWLPFITEDDSNLVHLGLGVRHSNAREGMRFATEPEFNKAPNFVDTDEFAANNTMTWNLEATWRKGPYWLAAEYINADADAPNDGDPNFSGYHVTASWILTGEMREYRKNTGILGPVPISRGAYQGGKGAWELGARWSSLDLTDGLIDGGELDIFSLGLTWWLSPFFHVNMNYRYIQNNQGGFNGESSGLMTRILILLE